MKHKIGKAIAVVVVLLCIGIAGAYTGGHSKSSTAQIHQLSGPNVVKRDGVSFVYNGLKGSDFTAKTSNGGRTQQVSMTLTGNKNDLTVISPAQAIKFLEQHGETKAQATAAVAKALAPNPLLGQ